MKISQKGLYALQAMMMLARHFNQGAIRIRDIAYEEGLPEKFLELILLELKNARMVESVRGAKGGYQLRRAPSEIHLSEIIRLIDGPLASLETSKLYKIPAENEWTIMQNLAHIVEFMPYWAGEIEKLLAEPGRNFGRTAQDEGRLRAISEHEMDSLAMVKAALPGSYARLAEVLGRLKDSDLELVGRHVKYGEQPLGWFIGEFVTGHLSGHVEQIKGCLEMVR